MSTANKTHISVETAKLLKDCEVNCKYTYQVQFALSYYMAIGEKGDGLRDKVLRETGMDREYPAYTWQEIWSNADIFFGKEKFKNFEIHKSKVYQLFQFWLDNEYTQADLYFRENCILIK